MTALSLRGVTGSVEAGTLDWGAAVFREHLLRRVDAEDYTSGCAANCLRYLTSFLAFVYCSAVRGRPQGVRIGSLRIEEAEQDHLTAWMIANYPRWRAACTRRDALGAVLSCFDWLDEQKLIKTSPFRRPRGLKFPSTHRRAMRKHHYRAIMRAARKEPGSIAFRLALFFAWHTGSRLKEMRTLEWDEVDLEEGIIRMHVRKNKTGKLTAEERIFGVGPRLLAVLKRMHARREPGETRVFLTRRGARWSKDNLGRRFARFRQLAGVAEVIVAAGSRHGYAVRLVQAGVEMKAIADQLGHKGTRMTESVYTAETRHDAEHVRNVAQLAERKSNRPVKNRSAAVKTPRQAEPCPLFDALGDR